MALLHFEIVSFVIGFSSINFIFNILEKKENTKKEFETEDQQHSLGYLSSASGCVLCTGATRTILSPRTNSCLTQRVSFSGDLVLRVPASASLPMSLSWSEGWTVVLVSRVAPWSEGWGSLISGHKRGHTGLTPSPILKNTRLTFLLPLFLSPLSVCPTISCTLEWNVLLIHISQHL